MYRSVLPFCSFAPLLVGLGAGQVPHGYLVTAEVPTAASGALRLVEIRTGIVTPLRPLGAPRPRRALTVGLDPGDPTAVYHFDGLNALGSLRFKKLVLLGNRIVNNVGAANGGRVTPPRRTRVHGRAILLTNTTGLHRFPLPGGQRVAQLAALPRAFGVTSIGNKAYVASYRRGATSTLIEVDLTSNRRRTLGSAYPAMRGLATHAGLLFAGTDTGDVLLINTTNGSSAVFARPAPARCARSASTPCPAGRSCSTTATRSGSPRSRTGGSCCAAPARSRTSRSGASTSPAT